MKRLISVLTLILCLLLNLNASTLSGIKSFDSGAYPRGIIIDDINSDGKSDVIVANFGEDTLIGQENDINPTSSISIFSGVNLIKETIFAGNSPRGLASGDINGDSITDFVVSNYADGTISVFIQKGKSLVLSDTIAVGKHPVGVAVYEGDVAVAVYSDSKLVVLKNNLKDKIEIPLPGNPTDVIMGKINNQKIIVSANYSAGSISVIAEGKVGILEKIKDINVGGGVCKVEIADVTGDKVNDIVTSNFYDNTISVIEYKSGNFTEPVNYKLEGQRPNGMAVGDVNGDGLCDVVTANRDSDSIDILIQKQGKLVLVKSIKATDDENKAYGPVEISIGDVNGDGKNDIVFTHMRSNTIKVIYQEKPGLPKITSLTHPDENQWYANNSPIINLKAEDDLTGIDGFYYSVSKNNLFDINKAKYTNETEIKLENLETGTYYFVAVAKDGAGNLSEKAIFKLNITEEMNETNTYNYPNPCSDSTVIRFPLTQSQEVRIIISDINGKVIWNKLLSEAEVIVGVNYVTWNVVNDAGISVANGVYICKVITKDKVITKKIVVMK